MKAVLSAHLEFFHGNCCDATLKFTDTLITMVIYTPTLNVVLVYWSNTYGSARKTLYRKDKEGFALKSHNI